MICDQEPQCSDSSDEIGCQCSSDEFRCSCYNSNPVSSICHRKTPCISKSKFRNCIRECADGSDEIANVRYFSCSGCESTVVVRRSSFCDISHCSATNCFLTSASLCSSAGQFICTTGCALGSTVCQRGFQCQDGELALKRHFCDDNPHCSDGTDELKEGYGFKCKGRNGEQCILPQRNLHDSPSQCYDGADACIQPLSSCFFKCFFSNVYIANRQVCDGEFNCPDFSDECLCDGAEENPHCQEKITSEPGCNLDNSPSDPNLQKYRDKDNLQKALKSSGIRFYSFIYVVGVLSFALNLTALIPLYGFYLSKIYDFDRFQLYFFLNICFGHICLASYLLALGSRWDAFEDAIDHSRPELQSITCSQAAGFAITGTEVLTFAFFALAVYRFCYPKYMEYLSKREAKKLFQRLIIAFVIVWCLAFLIAFAPLASSADFFSKTIWYKPPFTSRKIWTKPAIIDYACRWAKLSKKEPIFDLESAIHFSLRTSRLPIIEGEFSILENINICFLNFLAPVDSVYSSYMVGIALFNLLIYVIAVAIITVVKFKEKKIKKPSEENEQCINEDSTSENNQMEENEGKTIDGKSSLQKELPPPELSSPLNATEEPPQKVIPPSLTNSAKPDLDRTSCNEIDANGSSTEATKQETAGQQSIKMKHPRKFSSRKKWTIRYRSSKPKRRSFSGGNNAPTGDIESVTSMELPLESPFSSDQPQSHDCKDELSTKTVMPTDAEVGKSFVTDRYQTINEDVAPEKCSKHPDRLEKIDDQCSENDEKSNKGDDQSEKVSITSEVDLPFSKIPQKYIDYLIIANAICWIAFTTLFCLMAAGIIAVTPLLILALAFLFFFNGITTPLVLWYVHFHLITQLCCINIPPETEEEYIQRQIWLKEMNFIGGLDFPI